MPPGYFEGRWIYITLWVQIQADPRNFPKPILHHQIEDQTPPSTAQENIGHNKNGLQRRNITTRLKIREIGGNDPADHPPRDKKREAHS